MSKAGITEAPQSVRVHAREARWVVDLPENRVAFPASDAGDFRLANERRALRLLADRCLFAAPRVLFEDPSGRFDIRWFRVSAAAHACLSRLATANLLDVREPHWVPFLQNSCYGSRDLNASESFRIRLFVCGP